VVESDDSKMIDVPQAVAEAGAWGIGLRDWMELRTHAFGNVDAFGDSNAEDSADEEWRGRVAQVLIENGLAPKANRYIECCRYGISLQCKGPATHQLFSPLYCDLRYCPRCGPRQFARLMEKHSAAVKAVCKKKRRGYLLREITFTSLNTGKLSSCQVKKFNQNVKITLKKAFGGAKGWGALWCDEVGFNNTNLHAHVLVYGPYIEQSVLAGIWREISGDSVVYIKKAHVNGPKALIHLLKYVSKMPANIPEIIGQLEVAFHKCRRVHALGVFYNFSGEDTDNNKSEWTTCPLCGAELERLPGTFRLEKLIMEGRTFVGLRHPERKRACIN
jgi:hypothetical protein